MTALAWMVYQIALLIVLVAAPGYLVFWRDASIWWLVGGITMFACFHTELRIRKL